MSDEESIRDHIRVRRGRGCDRIFAREVSWAGPHRVRRAWRLADSLPAGADEAAVRDAVYSVVRDERFFRVCEECGMRQPAGLMHSGADYCQSCAMMNHGIVY